MGYRLHYASKHEVKLEGGAFKNSREEFDNLVSHEMEDSYANIGDSESYELYPTEVAAYIKKLANSDMDAVNEYFKTATYPLENKIVLAYLSEMYAGYDNNNDYIYVEWF